MLDRMLLVTMICLSGASVSLAQAWPVIGVDCNYALDMAARGKDWKSPATATDPLPLFAAHGCNAARIRLWVGDDGMNRLKYATQTALRAQQAGLEPYLVIFLSEDWADFVKQPAPAVWRDLTVEQKAAAVEEYAERVVRHMAAEGVVIKTFEIGNEIDFGVCGEFEEEWPKRVSLEYMRLRVWPRMIPILKGAQAGVLRARPDAKFIVHLTQWNNVEYCVAFWEAMRAAGVRVDQPGLSYFPTSSKQPEQRSVAYLQGQVATIATALQQRVVICETAYPAVANIGGQFAEWNQPVEGYPLTPEGQAQWIGDFMSTVRADANFAGVYYWSPEWYDGGLWDAFALFEVDGAARPGLRRFAR